MAFTTSTGPDTTPPTVTAQSPVAGSNNVAVNTAVTATFSEAMDPATITASAFELRGPAPASTLVTATVAYNSSTRTATLTPAVALSNLATYTVTVKGGATDPRVKDVAGNALAANVTWTFTTAAAGATGCSGSTTSIWPANPTPSVLTDSDTASVELGVKFRSSVNGFICGIRFYKGGSQYRYAYRQVVEQHRPVAGECRVPERDGIRLAAGQFCQPRGNHRQYHLRGVVPGAGGHGIQRTATTSLRGVTQFGTLSALSNAKAGGNGVYRYGSGGFPTNTFQSTNYWVDVLFSTSTGPDTTAPTVTSTLPASKRHGGHPANPVYRDFQRGDGLRRLSPPRLSNCAIRQHSNRRHG